MKLLAPNRHEVYFLIFSHVGYSTDILCSWPDETMKWRFPISELPENLSLIEWSDNVEQNLKSHAYDAVIILTLKDLWRMRKYRDVPLIFMIHISLYHHSLRLKCRWLVKRMLLAYLCWCHPRLTVAFSSPSKKSTWLFSNAAVIKHPPLPTPLCRKAQGEAMACTVGNHLNSREEVDFGLLERIRQQVPIHLIGRNPGAPDCTEPPSRQEFLATLCKFQIFVFVLQHPWEDGYNLAVLEAMQSGLVIVSMRHPTSLIRHGIDGFLCDNEAEMVNHIRYLKSHPAICASMGQAAQALVAQKFSMDAFVDQWRALLASASKR